MPTVAIGHEFLDAFAGIPKAQQKKVREFSGKFMTDPTSAAINYEPVHSAKDPKVRSVRMGSDYRAIILHPDHGDVYVLVWVDHHDEAMEWAKNKVFEINPVTGALQILNVTETNVAPSADPPAPCRGGLLSGFDDELLSSFGAPAILMPAVRAVASQEELFTLGKHLPAEAAEALFWLSEGLSVEEIREALAVPAAPETPVNTADLKEALKHPDSRRRFVTLKSQDDLDRMLEAPLEKWRVFLHPSQERLVRRDFKGPVRVLGGAGTGKTVIAMHRARHLASEVFTAPSDRILFTTFNANLAKNIQQNMANLCGGELERIDVLHLAAWAVQFMKSQGIDFQVATNDEIKGFRLEAYARNGCHDWDLGFLNQEWDNVIQFHGILDEQAYHRVTREGRSRVLGRSQRAKIWKIFEKYRALMDSQGKIEWPDLMRKTRLHIQEHCEGFLYRAVVVDEAQDFHPEEWKLMRALAPRGSNDIFLVGDAHQRIYGKRVVLSRYGIEVRGRAAVLRINYRTTEQIRNWAVELLRGLDFDDLDGSKDHQRGYRSLLAGMKPEIHQFETLQEAQGFIGSRLQQMIEAESWAPEEICLAARTKKMIDQGCVQALEKAGIPYVALGKDKEPEGGGVRVATMHRVKGLEFPCMILVGINEDVVPLRIASLENDPAAKIEHEARERSLLFVAATRAREALIVISWGSPSNCLHNI